MKKIILFVTLSLCIITVFTSCDSKTKNNSTPEATSTAKATTKTEDTPDNSSTSKEKLEGYRSGKGVIYHDVDNMMSANLIHDKDGYHLAMSHDNEYVPENVSWFVTFKDFGDEETSILIMEDGKQVESDIITLHGSLECLCLNAMSSDGMKTTEYSLYPIDNLSEDTSSNAELSEFTGILDNYDNKKDFYNDTMPDFLDDEQKKTFANADYLMFNINISTLFDVSLDKNYEMKDNAICNPTKMSYKSFIEYAETVFTPKFSASVLNDSEKFVNVRGELCVVDAARGANILYTGRSFKLISQSDDEIKFKAIAHYSYKDTYSTEEYNALPENEREYDEEYTITMVKTLDGWRLSEFDYWL